MIGPVHLLDRSIKHNYTEVLDLLIISISLKKFHNSNCDLIFRYDDYFTYQQTCSVKKDTSLAISDLHINSIYAWVIHPAMP